MSPVQVPAGDQAVRSTASLAEARQIELSGHCASAGGALRLDPGRPGLGLEAKWADLERYRVYGRSRE